MKMAGYFRSLIGISLFLAACTVICASEKKEAPDAYTYRPGVRNTTGKNQLNEKQLKLVIESLQAKTGFTGLRFDEAGFLTLDDPQRFAGGSASARELVEKAIQGKVQLVLENHSYSTKVAFASITNNLVFINMSSKAQMEHRSVHIDFTDFGKLIGSKEVRASFDLGIVLLHEFVHGAMNLLDRVDEWEEIGECERFVNTIRKELELPERQHYVARSQTVQTPMGWTVRMAELQFARTNYKNGTLKTDEFKLNWDVSRVGTGIRETLGPPPNVVATKNNERKSTASVP
ncbi:MAG: hypothetical protein JST84_11020 [Acidobacteria bacterium]|nr:hypothetical protein [Acidobacteriota bacterium]